MSINAGLKVLAGAVAIAISAGASAAVTTADANGSIILNLNDFNSGADYIFDTGLSVATFPGTSTVSFNLATDTNYLAFESAIATGDGIQYSVEGAATGTSPQFTLDFSGATTPVAQSGSNVSSAVQPIATLLNTAQNPAGGSVYFAKGVNPAFGWITGGYESTLVANTGVSDNATVGSPLAFYQATTDRPNKTTPGTGTLSTLEGNWTLSAGGVLSYNVGGSSGGGSSGGGSSSGGSSGGGGPPPTVPLPSTLLLLFSGLGTIGMVRRRRTGGSTSMELRGRL